MGVKDFTGSLSDYSECLVELESAKVPSSSSGLGLGSGGVLGDKKKSLKEDKQMRMQKMNDLKKNKREMQNIERKIEQLKEEATELEKKIEDSSEEGWTYLAELTETMNSKNEEVDEKEMRWLELAELIEAAESE